MVLKQIKKGRVSDIQNVTNFSHLYIHLCPLFNIFKFGYKYLYEIKGIFNLA